MQLLNIFKFKNQKSEYVVETMKTACENVALGIVCSRSSLQ